MKNIFHTLFLFFVCSLAIGSVANVTASPCTTNICLNGGVCGNFSGVANCTCPFGYNGLLCQNAIDYCQAAPCLHSGVCHVNLTNQPDGYSCDCSGTGYVGTTCQTEFCGCTSGFVCKTGSSYPLGFTCVANPCNSTTNPCQHNGTCSAASGTSLGYSCACTTGWGGDSCATQVSPCTPNLCQHGLCSPTSNTTFACNCTTGWSGPLCQFSGASTLYVQTFLISIASLIGLLSIFVL